MSETISFTAEQRSLIDETGSVYVEACPGAGKTRAIVERFVKRANPDPRRGVALISFTNAVVDEARSRCTGSDLLQSPNFVGTIDSFINHFVVGPLLTSASGRTQTFQSIWRHVAGSQLTAKNVQAQAELDWFDFSLDGNATLNPKRVPSDRAGMIRALPGWATSKLEDVASAQWKRNIARGVLDAAASRLYLMKYLNEPNTHKLALELLKYRFYEVIVDEVQDCSKEDVALLRLLLDAGARLILVGDPEQAIYGFRGGSASELRLLVQSLKRGDRLNGNFRSSANICTAVDSLRATSNRDVAVGPFHDTPYPVRVFSYKKPKDVRPSITAIAREHSVDAAAVVILAHATNKARSCAGAGPKPGAGSTNRLVRLAGLIHEVQDEQIGGRARAEALNGLESVFHQLSARQLAALGFEDFLDAIHLSRRSYRERCLRLATAVQPPYSGVPSDFKSDLASQSDAQAILQWSLSGVKIPNGDKWKTKPNVDSTEQQFSTIHAFKGLQSESVALVIPERIAGVTADEDGLSQWTNDLPGEARNVLYVGASRAEQLLILAVHNSVYDEVIQNLRRDKVHFDEFMPG